MPLSRLLLGARVRLTAIRAEDTPTVARWYEDSTFGRMIDAAPAYPRTETQVSRFMQEETGKDSFAFAVRPLDDDRLLGFVDLSGILWTHGVAWLGIGFGPEHQGKGYGYETMKLVLDFGFGELNLHRIQLTVFSYNTRARALYEKLGFQREGLYREMLHRDGQRYDVLLYGLLRREWLPDTA
ncbi:MAG: GNAT family N-acetyltransferase [Chloroflexi bacterium]|nr:GNAT family N-acetyltransferase [Chloroflexota bacterium]